MNKKLKISSILNNAESLPDIFKFYEQKFPEKNFLYKKENGEWVGKSFKELNLNIERIITFLKKLKIKKGDRVFLLSSNRIEWVEFDLAIMSIGAITVPSFVTNNINDNQFIINDCKPKLIIIENHLVYEENKKFLRKLKNSKTILIEKNKKFYNYNQIISKIHGPKNTPKINQKDISTIIYTSGTSNNPKGVVLSHESLIHNLDAALELINQFKIEDERFLSFLPLSHSYERMAGLYFPLLIGAEIFFCTSLEKLLNEIKEVKPTIVSAVPRLYENIYKKIKSRANKSGAIMNFILKNIFKYVDDYKKKNLSIFNVFFSKIFIKLFLSKKLKNNFGGKVKTFISGGAALSPVVGNFFNRIGLSLLQGYGQTEASPLISCNTKYDNDPETVGFPVKNVKIKISKDGEILVKGKNVMIGYWKNKHLTNQTIKRNWLHTGDLGYLDKIGRLVINGRKKDLIVTSGGDNISGQKIENLLTSQIEINQAVVYGDGKPFLIALIVLNEQFIQDDIKTVVDKVNKQLNSIERIRKYIVINEPFTYEKGLLTQTQKIKRDKVFNYYSKKINQIF